MCTLAHVQRHAPQTAAGAHEALLSYSSLPAFSYASVVIDGRCQASYAPEQQCSALGMHSAMNIAALAPARSKLTYIAKNSACHSAHKRSTRKLYTPVPSCTGAVLGVETHCAAPLGAALALR